MSRKWKLALGWVTIVLSFIVAGIGLWLLAGVKDSYSYQINFVLRFFLMFTPTMTVISVINLLRKEK